MCLLYHSLLPASFFAADFGWYSFHSYWKHKGLTEKLENWRPSLQGQKHFRSFFAKDQRHRSVAANFFIWEWHAFTSASLQPDNLSLQGAKIFFPGNNLIFWKEYTVHIIYNIYNTPKTGNSRRNTESMMCSVLPTLKMNSIPLIPPAFQHYKSCPFVLWVFGCGFVAMIGAHPGSE